MPDSDDITPLDDGEAFREAALNAMKLNSRAALIDLRRRRVAALSLRGLTQREIVAALRDFKNPDTGKPYSLGTINHDLQAVEEAWRKYAVADIHERNARLLAEIQEVRRAAWAEKDLQALLRGIKQEYEMTNGDSPIDHVLWDAEQWQDERKQRLHEAAELLEAADTLED
jgi:hypothetical protein